VAGAEDWRIEGAVCARSGLLLLLTTAGAAVAPSGAATTGGMIVAPPPSEAVAPSSCEELRSARSASRPCSYARSTEAMSSLPVVAAGFSDLEEELKGSSNESMLLNNKRHLFEEELDFFSFFELGFFAFSLVGMFNSTLLLTTVAKGCGAPTTFRRKCSKQLTA
jgi:hypothetical protein